MILNPALKQDFRTAVRDAFRESGSPFGGIFSSMLKEKIEFSASHIIKVKCYIMERVCAHARAHVLSVPSDWVTMLSSTWKKTSINHGPSQPPEFCVPQGTQRRRISGVLMLLTSERGPR